MAVARTTTTTKTKTMTKTMTMTVLAALAVQALAGCGRGTGEESVPPGREREAVLDAWRATEAEARATGGREGARRTDEFLSGVGLDALYALCATPPEDAEYQAALGSLLSTKLEMDPQPAEALAAWLQDPELSVLCRARVLRFAQRARDLMGGEEQSIISDALLSAATRMREIDGEESPDWVRAAAQFGRTDRVLSRVRELLAADDDATRARGALIAGESEDPRVAEALLDVLREVAADPDAYPESAERVAVTAARLLGARTLLPLEKLVVEGDLRGSAIAVPALGYVEHPRALELLLLVYGDAPRDPDPGADAFARAERQRLYDATRRLESHLVRALSSGSDAEAGVAFELLDRASRFGPLVRPPRVTDSLRAFRARGDRGVSVETIDAVIARVE